ncbi:MAG: DNA-3-methyladenine glycosylase 2 family protein [Cyanobacteria bacterium J06554_11]
MNGLDAQVCYQAMQANDRRFDGRFFVGVKTTGVFCRPICPARLPKFENCTFYLSAGAAQHAGYRPCLRCRPELAPASDEVACTANGTKTVVAKALRLIEAGALDEESVAALAARLKVSDRTLRQQFAQYVGASPGQVAKTRRLLFAKRLIDETPLKMTDVAMSAGFKSIRSFNSAFLQTYGRSPSSFRSGNRPAVTVSKREIVGSQSLQPITLKLPVSEPYNWDALMGFWQPRSVIDVEVATPNSYCRSIEIDAQQGWVSVMPVANKPYLQVEIGFPQVGQIGKIMVQLRRMFDVGVSVAVVESHLARSPLLKMPLQTAQGLRIPGAWNAFELSVRAIVGQQVSVAGATTVFNRLVSAFGEKLAAPGSPDVLDRIFPKPAALAAADLTQVGLIRAKAKAISTLAQIVAENPRFFEDMTTLPAAIKTLCALPGIGPWTAQYIAMRALNEPDALPPGDLALMRAAKRLGYEVSKREFEKMAEDWRPWRGYGAMYLWQFDAQAGCS